MTHWLLKNNISFQQDKCKTELTEQINKHKPVENKWIKFLREMDMMF